MSRRIQPGKLLVTVNALTYNALRLLGKKNGLPANKMATRVLAKAMKDLTVTLPCPDCDCDCDPVDLLG
jgi:hypothetical protein